MFIQNMTSREMVKEYQADFPEIDKSIQKVNSSDYVETLLYKGRKKNEISFVRPLKTSRNNNYINVFQYIKQSDSTNKMARWEWHTYTFALMQTFKGTCAITFFEEIQCAIVFQAHFFMRYKERLLKECDWQTRNLLEKVKRVEDVIPIYIQRNPTLIWVNTKSKFGDKEHIFAPVNDGVALIQWDGDNAQANTFITKSMYSLQQKDLVDYTQDFKQLQQEQSEIFQQLISYMEDNN